MKTCNKCGKLVSEKADLEKAKADAEYVNRLIERGISPMAAFLELNEVFMRGKRIVRAQ